MECRSSDIKIYPPMGKNFKGDGNFGISNWQIFLVFVLEDTVYHVRDSFYSSPDRSIRQVSYDIPFYSNKSLYTRDFDIRFLFEMVTVRDNRQQ
ncbi:uncharacterized protein TNCV_3659541 [Trichonephila clavipes]|nr:uncharacterized protein TNCV_3659541 [Trichonephila clavipes]